MSCIRKYYWQIIISNHEFWIVIDDTILRARTVQGGTYIQIMNGIEPWMMWLQWAMRMANINLKKGNVYELMQFSFLAQSSGWSKQALLFNLQAT